MTKLMLRYVQSFEDRHGKQRYYFRRGSEKRTPLPGLPGSTEFMAAYQAALSGQGDRRQIGIERTKPGTFNALIVEYYTSAEFKTLAETTQSTYRGIIERFRAKNGDKHVSTLTTDAIQRMLDKQADRPVVANATLAMLRLLMRFAKSRRYRKDDPTIPLKKLRNRTDGFHTWTDDEIGQFERRWKPGTKERLALYLLLYTAQRRSDVVRMGRQHVKGDLILVTQQKTGTKLSIPIHPALAAELRQVPKDQLTFLQTSHGKPFTAPGFTNWFFERAQSAGLPKGCSPHGLRKAASRRLAEAGMSASVIQSITGHKTLVEVSRYTAAADQEARARQAVAALKAGTASVKPRRKV